MKDYSTQINPKWGGVKLLLISVLTSFSVFSQVPPNQQNALNATGNVGVGTISPDSKLQVNGSMSIDSSLTVRDSAIFEKQIHMKDKIIVEGDAVIKGKLTAKDNLKVLGTTRIEGPMKLTNLNNAQIDDTTFLLVDANGKVKSASFPTVLNVMSANPQAASILADMVYGTLPVSCFAGYKPVWHNATGVLWVGTSACPASVGIMTDSPIAPLHVEGTSYFSSHTGMGIAPDTKIMLSIKSTPGVSSNADKIGLQVELVSPELNQDHYAIKAIVQNDGVKAIAVTNNMIGLSGSDVFRVYGDGKIWATGINIKNQTLFPDYVFDKNYVLHTFSELRNFIQQYHRLPGMPSAEEIEKNGLDLDKIVIKQQEKIEELTLYILALEQRLSVIENKTTTQP